jgi:hypothetical protein
VLSALAAALVLACATAPAAAWPPPGDFVITGQLETSVLLSVEALVANLDHSPVPIHTMTVSFQSGPTVVQRTFTGALLHDVLSLLRPRFDAAVRNDKLRFYVAATGSDGYQAIVAWGEIDPDFENKPVLLALIEDGQSLTGGPRLVVPGDTRGGRYVSDVVSFRVERVPPDPIVPLLPLGQ